ncbi:DUF411 domain-containing protein [Allosphingosinicella sp.]|uniref:DUF411 domain-containing protein n=1 Tax=Allosphingosinicella sp. TaxID=2823234 RepID=UPI002FC24769
MPHGPHPRLCRRRACAPADIKRLVKSGSRAIRGLAVPGMPAGSPGMDVGHDQKQPYKVYAFAADGRRGLFASHG